MRLYIGCPTGAEAYASVALLTATTQKEVGKFAIRVAGRAYDGPFEADSRAGASNFMSLLADLRKADAVVVYGGKTVTFPKSNAAKVLPVYGKKFHCNLG